VFNGRGFYRKLVQFKHWHIILIKNIDIMDLLIVHFTSLEVIFKYVLTLLNVESDHSFVLLLMGREKNSI
jgi:hypothetical protein